MNDNIKADLEGEKNEIAKSAQEIYDLWKDIVKERGDKACPFT